MTQITRTSFAQNGFARPRLTALVLNMLVATYVMALLNTGFWERLLAAYPDNPLRVGVFGVAIWALTLLTLELLGPWRLQKPVAALLILVAAGAHYYERNFGVLIDREMVRNVFATTMTESRHLITLGMLVQIGLTGVLPAALVFWPTVRRVTGWHQLWRWPVGVILPFALMLGGLLTDFKAYSATLRENRELMLAYQPGATLTAVTKFVRQELRSTNQVVKPLGRDARPGPWLAAADKPVLLVYFVGETARAQNFGLNGYERDTTPELRKRGVINFADTTACGTSTAVSLPCMFSHLPEARYSRDGFLANENLLDVLTHAGVTTEWWDNNTGDQRIAQRTGWAKVDATLDAAACAAGECTDQAFLPLIERTVATMTQNTVLALHMIGSHGPAYYLRYAPERAVYQPDCRTPQFSDCSVAEIVNAYDNTILETDRVLSATIDMLSASDRVIPAMLFVSDHGESLGENGLFLHAAPKFMAPDVQTKVPAVLWLDPRFEATLGLDTACLAAAAAAPTSHDILFHTVLGLLDIQTTAREAALDLTAKCRKARGA